jgi:TRAP-type C4-dicarboxylate transport system permease small subunit
MRAMKFDATLMAAAPPADRRPFALAEGLLQWAARLSRLAVWAGGALTLASVALITVDVLARKVAGRGVGGADELASYAFAISTAWSFSFAALQRAHVRVDVLYHRLPVRAAAVIDWLCLVTFAVFFAHLAAFGFEVVEMSWSQGSRSNSTLGMPLWVPQLLWFVGLAWMGLVLALLLLRTGLALASGDLATVQRWCGVRAAREEAVEEADVGRRIVQGERS